jgi:MoaA/NifB/PqqE/SkfB family radical SAM enzyme
MAQLESQMDAIERLHVRWVVFTGEPDAFESVRPRGSLRGRGIRVTVLSTGLLFERFAREITEHIDDAIVSLDGPSEIHDRIRRVPGGFNRIAAGVSRYMREVPVPNRGTVYCAEGKPRRVG